MSKVSAYLQSHIVGEVWTRNDVCEIYSRDGSVLHQKPTMVVHPRTVNDIRKVLRFSSQLAQKGHSLPVLARGLGTSITASSITSGIVLDTTVYLSSVLEYDAKQRLVRTQSGASSESVINSLRLHGTSIPQLEPVAMGTIGGYIGEGYGANLESNYEQVRDSVERLEVVLPGGEVIQTGPINKRELNKKKGVPGAEGDVYRGIDAIIEDYGDVIRDMTKEPYRDMSGYPGIVDVVTKRNSFDLTPLFIGAQGTLGIVAEAIMKAEFRPGHVSYGIAVFNDGDTARDALDSLRKLSPSFLDYADTSILKSALDQQVDLDWYNEAIEKLQTVSHVIIFGWQAFGDRTIERQLRKASKTLQKFNCYVYTPKEEEDLEELDALRDMCNYARLSTTSMSDSAPEIVGGFYVSPDNFEMFSRGLHDLETELHIDLPIYGSALSNIYTVLPSMSLKKVGDKQKIFKIVDQLRQLIEKNQGIYYARGGEGRLTAHFANTAHDDRRNEMTAAIKKVFDPHDILNTGVKQDLGLPQVASMMRSDNSLSAHLTRYTGM